MDKQPCIVIVGDHADPLSSVVATYLQAKGLSVLHASPGDLGDLQVCLQGDRFCVSDQRVNGILFRAFPDAAFCKGFVAQDRAFCAAETKAIWLAALHLESVLAINAYDAAAWFEGLRWPVWRRKLIEGSVPVSPFVFGCGPTGDSWHWRPYTAPLARSAPGSTTQRVLGSALTQSAEKQASLVVCSQVIDGKACPAVLQTARLLKESGLGIAEVATDAEDRVLSVHTIPSVTDSRVVELAAQLICKEYYAHLYCR